MKSQEERCLETTEIRQASGVISRNELVRREPQLNPDGENNVEMYNHLQPLAPIKLGDCCVCTLRLLYYRINSLLYHRYQSSGLTRRVWSLRPASCCRCFSRQVWSIYPTDRCQSLTRQVHPQRPVDCCRRRQTFRIPRKCRRVIRRYRL